MPKFSINTANSSGRSKRKVFVELQFKEQIEPPKLQRNVSLEAIITKQPG